mmetsp:Transcript_3068/g.6889  ORF Transcript_3068/g.6889 Transcript_3068/m.6889 type:complete len:236 (+) Transcript_3068:532-1239(+)
MSSELLLAAAARSCSSWASRARAVSLSSSMQFISISRASEASRCCLSCWTCSFSLLEWRVAIFSSSKILFRNCFSLSVSRPGASSALPSATIPCLVAMEASARSTLCVIAATLEAGSLNCFKNSEVSAGLDCFNSSQAIVSKNLHNDSWIEAGKLGVAWFPPSTEVVTETSRPGIHFMARFATSTATVAFTFTLVTLSTYCRSNVEGSEDSHNQLASLVIAAEISSPSWTVSIGS